MAKRLIEKTLFESFYVIIDDIGFEVNAMHSRRWDCRENSKSMEFPLA